MFLFTNSSLQIVIAPELEKGSFTGSTDIFLNVLKSTNKIVLHAADLILPIVEIHKYDPKFDKYYG